MGGEKRANRIAHLMSCRPPQRQVAIVAFLQTEICDLILVGAQVDVHIPVKACAFDDPSSESKLDASVLDLTDVHKLPGREPRGRRNIPSYDRILGCLIVVGEINRHTTTKQRRIESRFNLHAPFRSKLTVAW